MYAHIFKAKDKTAFGEFMSNFFHSAHNKNKYKAPRQMVAVALSVAERRGLHYVPASARKSDFEIAMGV